MKETAAVLIHGPRRPAAAGELERPPPPRTNVKAVLSGNALSHPPKKTAVIPPVTHR